MNVFGSYLLSGFLHVLPLGYDHLLFIIALFFLDSRWTSALLQCTVFTIAHTATLALAVLGYVSLPARLVECTIAFSIFIMAVENIIRPLPGKWRILLIFIFGLMHGMGFASALREQGLPDGKLVPGLLGFNLGVELAQVSVILLCFFGMARWWREKPWYRDRVVMPLSAVIGGIALIWSIDRLLE